MSSSESKSGVVLELAEEFLERYRRGERPALKEYADRHPELAAEIREVFPAMALMENIALADESLAGSPTGDEPAKVPAPLEQLGDFRIIRTIGRGGMGVVYEAEQLSLGRHVALKVLPTKALLDGKQKRRFEREAKAAARLHHTNIVPVFGFGEHDGLPYYVMQFIQGLGLDEVLDELKRLHGVGQDSHLAESSSKRGIVPYGERSAANAARSLLTGRFEGLPVTGTLPAAAREHAPERTAQESTPVSGRLSDTFSSASVALPGQAGTTDRSAANPPTYWQSVARIGVQVANALEYAHKQGVLHRDIKPSNLLLDNRGTVWVTDFGLAKADDQQDLTRTGDILGTLRYMPPEAFEGKSDARGDLYSLGLTLYELLAFRPAFAEKERNRLVKQVTTGEPPRLRRLNRAVPSDLATVVHKAIDREPGRRYQSAAEMADDLRRFLDDEPIHARRVSLVERLARWSRHNPAVAGLLAALVLVFVVGFAGVFWQWIRAEGERDRAAQLAYQEAEARDRAVRERDEKERLRVRERGFRLLAQSSATLSANPGLALLLAIEGADQSPGPLANNALLAALESCHEERMLREEEGRLRSAVFSADGRQLVTLSGDTTVRIRDAVTGDVRVTVRGFETTPRTGRAVRIDSAVLSPDGRLLLTTYDGYLTLMFRNGTRRAYTDRVAHVWDAATGRFLFSLRGHTDRVTMATFSPDGRHILTSSRDRTARLWDAATGREVRCLCGHQGQLIAAVFSPDGGRVLTLTTGRVDGHDYPKPGADGKPVDLDPPAVEPIDANQLIGWGGGGSSSGPPSLEPGFARVWDVARGKELAALKFKNGSFGSPFAMPFSAAFHPEGPRVLVHFSQGVAVLDPTRPDWHVQLCDPSLARTDSEAWFSPDGRRLLTLSGTGVRLWDAETGRLVVTLQGHSRPVVSAQFSADGRWIVTASEDRTARVWDAATGAEVLGLRGHSQALLSAAFSPDSRRVVTVSTDGTVRLWRADPERVYGLPLKGHHKPLTAVAFSRDGRRLVTASEDRTARIWDAATGNQLAVLSAGEGIKPLAAREHLFGTVRQAMFSPDGRRVLTVAADPQACLTLNLFRPKESRIPVPFAPARLWDAVTSKEVLGLQWRTAAGNDHPNFPGMGQKNGLEAGRFSADGKRVLTIEDGDVRLVAVGAVHGGPEMAMHSFGNERTVRVWDAATGKELAALKGHDPGSLGADISPDGRHVVTGSRLWRSAEVAIRLWDVAGGKERFRLKQEGVCPYPLFSTDGQRILGFQRDRLHIWDLKGNVVGRFDATANQPGRPDAAVTFAALSEDGRRAVAVCGDEARVWDVTAGKALALLTGHEQTIRTAQFSPDGRLVVTASDDETARIWDAATGTERFTLSGHKGAVVCACFSPDGKTVATASADGTARLWPIDPLAIARARTPREFTALERRRFEIDR